MISKVKKRNEWENKCCQVQKQMDPYLLERQFPLQVIFRDLLFACP